MPQRIRGNRALRRSRSFGAPRISALLTVLLLAACSGPGDGASPSPSPAAPSSYDVHVTVHLDGVPVAGADVLQGGRPDARYPTDADGRVTVSIDPTVDGEPAVIAAHPSARSTAKAAYTPDEEILLELISFDTTDNPAYLFNEPGRFDIVDKSTECTHCHKRINEDWYFSAHRSSASNPALHDLYDGTAHAFTDELSCNSAGGAWLSAPEPGTGAIIERCFIGSGVIESLNPDCGPGLDCATPPTAFGACADCHAPAIDGVLGGRSLHEAEGWAFSDGVHCDLCHKVESVDLAAPAGVAGRLRILRPSEPSPSPSIGDWLPITFGPWPDVPTLFMGGVERSHFTDGALCAGCHELNQPPLAPGASLDPSRWPEGTLPIHSTYSEWSAANFAPCGACHLPRDPDALNAADLGDIATVIPGIVPGWPRPSGSVRRHTFTGPRTEGADLLGQAASLSHTTSRVGDELTVSVTVTSIGTGHALPTGDPMRAIIALVRVTCAGEEQTPSGGHVVSDVGAYLALQDDSADWSLWPGAAEGEEIRVVRRTAGFHDYPAVAPFDGFTPEQKGLPVDEIVGVSRITAVNGDMVTVEPPLPSGDFAYRVSAPVWPPESASGTPWAGHPGFAFARVTADAAGNRGVPHYLAVDLVSDNRIPPGAGFTSEHRFTVTCAAPEVETALIHRRYAIPDAAIRGWLQEDRRMR